jgi:ribosomal protein L15
MVPNNTAHVKVLARGTLTKPLTVCAGQFSMDAVKMIFLVGGKAIKTLDD